ncbi:MAG: hypothetical protein MJY42_05060, partial [Bacteroidales bacterium]|nr:hypothetical protein [Bacteroidales bacterium]
DVDRSSFKLYRSEVGHHRADDTRPSGDGTRVPHLNSAGFYDIMFQWAFLHPVSVDAAYVENNIVSYSADNTQYQRFLWTSTDDGTTSMTTPASGYPDAGMFKDNIRFNTGKVLGVMNYSINLAGKSWYPADYQEITTAAENPFATVDAANGVFTQKPAFAAYGAQR